MIEWFCEGVSTKHGHFKIIRKDGFCADPFLLNTDIVLYEFFSYKDERGWIEAYDIGLGVSYKVFDNYRHAYQTAIKLDLTWRQRNLLPYSFMTSKPSEFLYSYAFKENKYYLKKIRENRLFNKAISS